MGGLARFHRSSLRKLNSSLFVELSTEEYGNEGDPNNGGHTYVGGVPT